MSARVIPLVAGTLETAGVEPAAVLTRVGLERLEVDAGGRIAHAVAFDLFHAATRVTGDEAFGLHVAESLRPGALGAIDYLIRSGPTLGAALAAARRYQRLIQDAELCLEIDRRRAIQRYRLYSALEPPPPVTECVIAGAVVWTRQITGTELDPLEVRFAHARPRDTREHERIFRAPVRFGAGETAVVFAADALERPLVDANPGLLAVLEQHAGLLLQQLPRTDHFAHRVSDLIAADLRAGAPRLGRVAADLHMSTRTLRRRLRDEGTTGRRLVDELRCELAMGYLRRRGLGIGEVAFLLGFSDTSAFHKAFRRWTGRSPGAYRRSEAR